MRSLKSALIVAMALAIAPALLSASDRAEATKKETNVVRTASTGTSGSQFAALKGVKAVPMSSSELKAVKGQHVHFIEPGNGFSKIHLAGNPEKQLDNWYDNGSPDGELVAPSYHGLCVAAGTGPAPIGIPVMPGRLSQCP